VPRKAVDLGVHPHERLGIGAPVQRAQPLEALATRVALVLGHPQRGQLGGQALEVGAYLGDMHDVGGLDRGDRRAAPRLHGDQPFEREALDRVAQRRAADRELRHQLVLAQDRARPQLDRDDAIAQFLVGAVGDQPIAVALPEVFAADSHPCRNTLGAYEPVLAEEAGGDRPDAGLLDVDRSVHGDHLVRGEAPVDVVDDPHEAIAAEAVELVAVDHERDVLVAEQPLGVEQHLVVPRRQLAVGREYVGRIDVALVECGVLGADGHWLEPRVGEPVALLQAGQSLVATLELESCAERELPEAAQVGDRPQVLALSEIPRRRDRVDVLERRLPAERLVS